MDFEEIVRLEGDLALCRQCECPPSLLEVYTGDLPALSWAGLRIGKRKEAEKLYFLQCSNKYCGVKTSLYSYYGIHTMCEEWEKAPQLYAGNNNRVIFDLETGEISRCPGMEIIDGRCLAFDDPKEEEKYKKSLAEKALQWENRKGNRKTGKGIWNF